MDKLVPKEMDCEKNELNNKIIELREVIRNEQIWHLGSESLDDIYMHTQNIVKYESQLRYLKEEIADLYL